MEQGTEAASGAASFVMGAAKAGPGVAGVAVSGLTWAGLPLSDWVYVATLIWIGAQTAGWVWDRFYIRRREAKRLICDLTGRGCDDES